jgi:hypothetical protein
MSLNSDTISWFQTDQFCSYRLMLRAKRWINKYQLICLWIDPTVTRTYDPPNTRCVVCCRSLYVCFVTFLLAIVLFVRPVIYGFWIPILVISKRWINKYQLICLWIDPTLARTYDPPNTRRTRYDMLNIVDGIVNVTCRTAIFGFWIPILVILPICFSRYGDSLIDVVDWVIFHRWYSAETSGWLKQYLFRYIRTDMDAKEHKAVLLWLERMIHRTRGEHDMICSIL